MRNFLLVPIVGALAAMSQPAFAETGDVLIKARGAYDVRSGTEQSLQLLDGSTVSVKPRNSFGAEISAAFFLTDQLAVEASFAGSSYDVAANGGAKLFSAGMIRPAVTVQYYPVSSGAVRPYFGGGVAYVNVYSAKPGALLTNQVLPLPASYAIDTSSKAVAVGQVGVDVSINQKFYINIDGKYLHAGPDFTVNQTPDPLSALGPRSLVQTRNPNSGSFIVSAGLGFKY